MKNFEDYPSFIQGFLGIIAFLGVYFGAGALFFLPWLLFEKRIIGVWVLEGWASLSIVIAVAFYFKMKEKNKYIQYLVYMVEGNLAHKRTLSIVLEEEAIKKGTTIMDQALANTNWVQSMQNEKELGDVIFYLVNKYGVH